MEYNYNNTMTISTSGPKNEMNARWALQNTLEGKALVYNECIKPLVGNRPQRGISSRWGKKNWRQSDWTRIADEIICWRHLIRLIGCPRTMMKRHGIRTVISWAGTLHGLAERLGYVLFYYIEEATTI